MVQHHGFSHWRRPASFHGTSGVTARIGKFFIMNGTDCFGPPVCLLSHRPTAPWRVLEDIIVSFLDNSSFTGRCVFMANHRRQSIPKPSHIFPESTAHCWTNHPIRFTGRSNIWPKMTRYAKDVLGQMSTQSAVYHHSLQPRCMGFHGIMVDNRSE